MLRLRRSCPPATCYRCERSPAWAAITMGGEYLTCERHVVSLEVREGAVFLRRPGKRY